MLKIRYADMLEAVNPDRHLVKVVVPTLWVPPLSDDARTYRPGTEKRSDLISVSLFEGGSAEQAHAHAKSAEYYLTLEGRLAMAVRPYRSASWELIELQPFDSLLVEPGEVHLASSDSEHKTLVIQAPPSLDSDRIMMDEADSRDAAAIEEARRLLRGDARRVEEVGR